MPVQNLLSFGLLFYYSSVSLEHFLYIFAQLVNIAQEIPRTKVLENNDSYWKGVCRSLIFRFPDDLEILKLGKKIQIKSASRYGGGDLGVNGTRVGRLLTELERLKTTSKKSKK